MEEVFCSIYRAMWKSSNDTKPWPAMAPLVLHSARVPIEPFEDMGDPSERLWSLGHSRKLCSIPPTPLQLAAPSEHPWAKMWAQTFTVWGAHSTLLSETGRRTQISRDPFWRTPALLLKPYLGRYVRPEPLCWGKTRRALNQWDRRENPHKYGQLVSNKDTKEKG